ncbi:MAG TPA: hypothetical protein VLS27_13755 [Gammaproteobacteria bacterium]|nr:hypothetical protein [Gammaproteobacteria bacterium]
MSCDGTCERTQFKIAQARFIHIAPRPRSGSPADLEQRLLKLVYDELENDSDDCDEGCECAIGEPVKVASRVQIKKVSDGTYSAWYEVTLEKYRTSGECMPAADSKPEGVR